MHMFDMHLACTTKLLQLQSMGTALATIHLGVPATFMLSCKVQGSLGLWNRFVTDCQKTHKCVPGPRADDCLGGCGHA